MSGGICPAILADTLRNELTSTIDRITLNVLLLGLLLAGWQFLHHP